MHGVRAQILDPSSGEILNEYTIIESTQIGRGNTLSLNLENGIVELKPGLDARFELAPGIEVEDQQETLIACTPFDYRLVLRNPNGSERFSGTQYTREQVNGPITTFAFEDKALPGTSVDAFNTPFGDADFNDVLLTGIELCNTLNVSFDEVNAGWVHQVRVEIF